MEELFQIVLFLHIAGGTAGLSCGTINLLRKKGDKIHGVTGKIFTYSMLLTGLSAIFLSALHPNLFLFTVGIFTLYMTTSGVMYLRMKQPGKNERPGIGNWLISASMLVAALFFIGMGILSAVRLNFFGLVFAVFGAIGLLFVVGDFKNYRGFSKTKNYWLKAHIGRITGAYIASLTAFLVVNGKYLPFEIPGPLLWLLPSVIVVPFIIRWSRRYAVKKRKGKKTKKG